MVSSYFGLSVSWKERVFMSSFVIPSSRKITARLDASGWSATTLVASPFVSSNENLHPDLRLRTALSKSGMFNAKTCCSVDNERFINRRITGRYFDHRFAFVFIKFS